LIALSAASFGAMAVLVKIARAAEVDLFSILALRFAIASAVLVPLAAARKARLPTARVVAALLLLGGIGYVAHSFCFYTALEYSSAGLAALLMYLYPALVALGGAIFFGDRLGKARLAALALAFAGTVLAIDPGGSARPLGMALALACAAIYATYILVCSRVTRGVDPMVSSSVIIIGAAIIYGAIAAVRGSPLPGTSGGWIAVLAIALISTAFAIAAFFAALERIGPTPAAIGSTLEPAVTVALGAAFLGERLSPMQLVGGALIVAAVIWLSTRPPAASP
jgi:drug/metabolite transporter (DMT)-like permease